MAFKTDLSRKRIVIACSMILTGLVAVLFAFFLIRFALNQEGEPMYETDIHIFAQRDVLAGYIHRKGSRTWQIQSNHPGIFLLFGSFLVFLGLLLFRKQWKLRTLVMLVVFPGLLGALPYAIPLERHITKGRILFNRDHGLTSDAVDSLNMALRNDVVFSSLPEGMKQELAIRKVDLPEIAVERQAVDACIDGVDVAEERLVCAMTFRKGMTEKQVATLFHFYNAYLCQALVQMDPKLSPPIDQSFVTPFGTESEFHRWFPVWKKDAWGR
jgi:hypothetical protein